jgi:hypothetical protein
MSDATSDHFGQNAIVVFYAGTRVSYLLKTTNVVGARPNLPLIRESVAIPRLNPSSFTSVRHYDDALSSIFFRQMGIPAPDSTLAASLAAAKLGDEMYAPGRTAFFL